MTEFDRRNAPVLNRYLQDYLVRVNADIQEVKVIIVSETDTHVNPAGVKGLGEHWKCRHRGGDRECRLSCDWKAHPGATDPHRQPHWVKE